MFRSHQPLISAYAKSSPDAMHDVMVFVLCTIQQALHTVPMAMDSIRKEGAESRFIWGFKRKAYENLVENKEAIYRQSMALYDAFPNPDIATRELLMYFANIDGFGLAKGAFCVQLIFGLCGCIDSHNVARFGLNPTEFKASRFKAAKQYATKYQFLDTYIDLVELCGGCERMWDEWCEYVYESNKVFYRSAQHVSAIHAEVFGLIPKGRDR